MKPSSVVAGHALGVGGPAPQRSVRGQRRRVARLHQLELCILVVKDLEEEHPAELGDALRVSVDAGVLPHDVLDGLDRGSD